MRTFSWPFPSLDSLRNDESSGLETGVMAAILIVPLSVWVSGVDQVFGQFGLATTVLVSASFFVLLCFQVAIWVGFFFRAMEAAPSGVALLCLIGFGCYVATIAWSVAELDRLVPCLIFLHTVGALALAIMVAWDEWEPITLRSLAVVVCLVYFVFAYAYPAAEEKGGVDCTPLASSVGIAGTAIPTDSAHTSRGSTPSRATRSPSPN